MIPAAVVEYRSSFFCQSIPLFHLKWALSERLFGTDLYTLHILLYIKQSPLVFQLFIYIYEPFDLISRIAFSYQRNKPVPTTANISEMIDIVTIRCLSSGKRKINTRVIRINADSGTLSLFR